MAKTSLNTQSRPPDPRHPVRLIRYGIAVLVIMCVSWAIHYLPVIGEWGRGTLLLFFFANVMVNLCLGFFPGLLALIFSLIGINVLLLLPIWHSTPNHALFLNLGFFLLSSIMIILIQYYHRHNQLQLESQQDLNLAQEVAQVGSWRFKVKGNLLYWTDEKYRIFEIPVGTQVTFDTFLSAIHPEDREYVDRMWQASLQGEPYDIEHRILVAGDKVKWIREKAILEFGKDGILLGGFGTTQDITERKLAEQELRGREKKLQIIMDLTPSLVCYLSPDLKYVEINKAHESWWDKKPEQILGHQVQEIVDHHIWEAIQPHLEQARIGNAVSFNHRFENGRWIQAHCVPDIDASRQVKGIATYVADITELKRAEQQLVENEQRVRLATTATGIGIWEWHLTNNKIHWDAKMFDIYGVPETEDGLVDYSVWRRLVMPDEISQQEQILHETIRSGGYNRREFHIQRPDGTIRLLEAVETIRTNTEGKSEWVVGTNLDITERKHAELAIKERENQLQLIMDMMPAIISYMDCDFKYLRVNKVYEEWFGIAKQDIIGRTPREIIGEEAWRLAAPQLERARRGELVSYEQHTTYGNVLRWTKKSFVPVKDETGKVKGIVVHVEDISDQKNHEQALIEKENFLSLIINAMPALVAYVDADFRYVRVNKTYEKWFGIPVEHIVGSKVKDILGDAGWQKIKPYLEMVMLGEEIHYDLLMPYKTGKARWIQANYVPHFDSSGRVKGIVALVVDISEITEAHEEIATLNEELQQTVEELEAIFDAAPIGLAIAETPDGRHIRGNTALEEMVGMPAKSELSLRGKDPAPYKAYQDGRELTVEELPMQCAAQGKSVRNFIFDILRPDGKTIAVLSNAVPLMSKTGIPRGAVGAFLDITALKKAEAALIASEERLRLAQTAGALGIYDHNLVTGELLWDQRILDIWGLHPKQSFGLASFLKAIHPDDYQRVKATVKGSLDPKVRGEYHTEYRVIRPIDQGMIWVSAYGIASFKGNKAVRLVGYIQEITERKQAEFNLLETEARLALAIKELNAGYWDWNLETNEIFLSPEWKQQLGYSDSEVPNRHEEWETRLHPEDKPGALSTVKRFIEGEIPNYELEFRLQHKDGSYRWILSRAALIQFPSKRLVGIHLDITNYKQAIELSRQRNKMEEAFRLRVASQTVAAIAHELNQPLTAISYFADVAVDMLKAGNKSPEKLATILDSCSDQAQRAGQAIKQLMAVLEKGDIKSEQIDINKMVRNVHEHLKANNELNSFGFEMNLAAELPMVSANRLQIQKILINLIRNSLEAMLEAGNEAGTVSVTTRLNPDNPTWVQVTVKDKGVGVSDASELSTIFKPFYTTKENGLGMGLAISRGLIEAHGGKMWAEQNADIGISVHFTLPLAL